MAEAVRLRCSLGARSGADLPDLRPRWSGRVTTTRKLWTCERSASVGLPIAADMLRRRRKFEKYLRHPLFAETRMGRVVVSRPAPR